MAFWGIEVKPGKPFTHTADDARGRLHISQATLGTGIATKKSVVQCNVGDKSPVFLCSLFPEKTESCQLNLEFEEANDVVFSVIGPRSVHLTGYFFGGGRRYNLNDESESYGEDIMDTETERSPGRSDEDEYDDDSFINDNDLEVLPPSPLSNGGVIEETLGRKQPKNGKGSGNRRRRKYQLSESEYDDDNDPQQGMLTNVIEETLVSEQPKNGKDSRRRPRKKYQLSESESDNDNDRQQGMFANGTTDIAVLDSENEDMLPISSICKSKPAPKSERLEAEEKPVRKSGETSNTEAKNEGHFSTMSERTASVDDGEPKRPNLCDSVLPPVELGPENGAKAKKKRKEKSKEGKHLNVMKGKDDTEEPEQDDTEAEKMIQNLSVRNEENQKPDNKEANTPQLSVPSTKVEHENGVKSKKKKKEKAKKEGLEADNGHHGLGIEKDEASQDNLKAQIICQDIPVGNEQNQKQDNDEEAGTAQLSVPSTKEEHENDAKPKKKKREGAEEHGLEADKDEAPQAELEAQNKCRDIPVGNEQNQKQANDEEAGTAQISVPSTNEEHENGAKPKKKKREGAKEEHGLEADNDEAPQDELGAQNLCQDIPVGNEQNQKQANDDQVRPDSDAKPKKRKRKERAEEKTFEANSGNANKDYKAHQDEVKSDIMEQDLPVRVEETEKEDNIKIINNDGDQSGGENKPEEKRKKRRNQEDAKVKNEGTPQLSMDSKNTTSLLRTLSNGVVIEELGPGKPNGKVAASGKKVYIKYTGKLKENGEVFDSNAGGTPFRFCLGQDDIIEGLDTGVEGMRVGDKRRIVIPPSLGFGSEGDGMKVPPDSWLVYDVELIKVR